MPQRPAYQHVIFDFDGTLVDSAPAILATFASILDEARLPPAIPLDKTLIGPPLIPTLTKISGSQNPELIERLARRFKAEYDEHKLPLTAAYPGAADTLKALSEFGLVMHIATNKREKPTLRLLDLFGWRGYFSSVYCIDSPPNGSPGKAEMLERLLAEQDISKDEVLFVGDTETDSTAATSNALAFCGVTWGYGRWNSFACPNGQVVKSFADLRDLLQPH